MAKKRRNDQASRNEATLMTKTPQKKSSEVEDDDERNPISDEQIAVVVFSLLLVLYTSTLHPSVPGGDSGELIISAHELGVAHPPGYPLFTLMSKLAMMLLPWGTAAFRVNLMTALCSAAAGAFLQLATLKITKDLGSSFLTIGLFSVSRLTWTWSVTAEVFGLNNLLLALLLWLLVIFDLQIYDCQELQDYDTDKIFKIAGFGALTAGLALSNQHTSVIYIVFIALHVLYTLWKESLLMKNVLLLMAGSFLVGISFYLYLPASSFLSNARWTWGDHSSIQDVVAHVLRSHYGTFSLGKDTEGQGLAAGINVYVEHCHEEMWKIALPLMSLGVAIALFKSSRGSSSVLLSSVMLAAYILFFSWRANLDINNPLLKGVVERFWMQADLIVAFLAATSVGPLLRWLVRNTLGEENVPMSSALSMFCAVVVTSRQIGYNYPACNQSKNLVVHDFAHTLLKSLPRNAVVLTHGDLPTNSMRYFHLCERLRPDVSLVDIEMMSMSWFIPKMKQHFGKVRFPGDIWQLQTGITSEGKKSFNFKTFLDANSEKRKIFACIGMADRDPSWESSYKLWPFGPCHQILKKSQQLNAVKWAELTSNYSDSWTYGYDIYDETSWEKVANDEMWAAKINTAFFMYNEAEATQDQERKKTLLVQAFELYFAAIKKNQKNDIKFKHPYPPFWHKNFALVCERLLNYDTHLSRINLSKMSINHFQLYILQSKDDPEVPKIQQIIEHLEGRLKAFLKIDEADNTIQNLNL